MYRHHTFEKRLHVVSRIQLGEPLESLCRKERLDKRRCANGISVIKNTEKKGCGGHGPTTTRKKKR